MKHITRILDLGNILLLVNWNHAQLSWGDEGKHDGNALNLNKKRRPVSATSDRRRILEKLAACYNCLFMALKSVASLKANPVLSKTNKPLDVLLNVSATSLE